MEAARNLISSPPAFSTRTQLKNSVFLSSSSSSSSSSSAPAATSVPITSVARRFPTSALSQEQRYGYRPLPVLHFFKEDKTYPGATDKQQMENGTSLAQLGFEQQLLQWPDLRLSLLDVQSITADTEEILNVDPSNIVALAKKALSVSKQTAALDEDFKLDIDDSLSNSLASAHSSTLLVEEEAVIVRSTRRLERQSKRRRVRPKVTMKEKGFYPNDPFRLFFRGPGTKQLLTAKEESELIIQVQDMMRLMKVKSKLQSQFGREPTLVEWAEAMGVSCSYLQKELNSGNRSQEKLICANLGFVVCIAKWYQGRGLSLHDLMQEGIMGLMKSIEKFKPEFGYRFLTYAYWWIRQKIAASTMQHSRTIHLPVHVYGLLNKVWNVKRSYIQEGNYCPSKEELARRVGITVEKLDKLLFTTRMPESMQQAVWADQATTFQEVTPDTGVEIPDVSVAKQLMRQHVRNLLSILSPRERKIIRLRFGIGESKRNSLLEIGNMFGLTKERVRQIESHALCKLKQCLTKQGLEAYVDLLV